MKRWIALALVIAAFCAMALGSGHKRPIDTSEPDVSALKPKERPSTAAELGIEEAPEPVPAGPTFEETVLYDRGGVKLTATGIAYDAEGPAVECVLENRSDRYVFAACDGLAVDGYWLPASMGCTATPGQTANGKLAISPDLLAVCGIGEIGQVDLEIGLRDVTTGKDLPGVQRVRLRTDAARDGSYTADKTGRVVYYRDGIELTIKGRDGRGHRSADPVLCVGNASDAPIRVELTGFSVNGVPFETEMTCAAPAGTVAIGVIHASRAELSKRGLWPVERYTLRFAVYDAASGDLIAAADAFDIDYADLRALP